jgi:hypothetical protein
LLTDADPNRQTLESGLDLDAMDGAPNGLPMISWPRLAVQDPGKRGKRRPDPFVQAKPSEAYETFL